MSRPPAVICVDFETEKIEDRPNYPPVPGSFSIQWPGERKPKYFAWNHDTKNNCDKNTARRELLRAWKSGIPLLFYHGKFDIDVAEVHFDMPVLSWEMYHDAMYFIFLHDPHARDMRLKPQAKLLLGMEPEERDAVQEWLVDNKVIGKQQKAQWAQHILRAPGDVVGPYAGGDVIRTLKLFQFLWKDIEERGMMPAYDRERECQPILLESERGGVCADLPGLERDKVIYDKEMERADQWLRKRLKVPDLNVDADIDFADALDAAGVVTDWVMTAPSKTHPNGQRSVAKGNLTPEMFIDKRVAQVYGYRNRLATCQRMFMDKWLDQARQSNGLIYTNWNQVRQPKGGKDAKGTRTGRLSSNPNFQNLSKGWTDEEGKNDHYVHPEFAKLKFLPYVRQYVLPDHGGVFMHRDYNQQELRLLAHFEDAALMQAYSENPWLDVHQFVKELIQEITSLDIPRGPVKIINFGKIYGQGIGSFAVKIGCSVQEAKRIVDAHGRALPGLKDVQNEIKALVKEGYPITTWGGRQYYVEDPVLYQGRWLDFTYKLLNYLIQGSAADVTKQAIINYHNTKLHGRFLITVHDEINITAPTRNVKSEMAILRESMESIRFDVPMISDAKVGPSWYALTKYDEPKFNIKQWRLAA